MPHSLTTSYLSVSFLSKVCQSVDAESWSYKFVDYERSSVNLCLVADLHELLADLVEVLLQLAQLSALPLARFAGCAKIHQSVDQVSIRAEKRSCVSSQTAHHR